MLVSLLMLAIAGVGVCIEGFFQQETYGSKLEQYIVSHNPRDTADIERLAREYDMKAKEGFL